MKPYAKYKKTEIEWINTIPEHWITKKLGYMSQMIVPMRDKPKDLTGPIPWLRIEDFEGKYVATSRTNQGVSKETIEKMNLKVFPVGTVLCSCSCAMGKTAIVQTSLLTNQTFIGIVPTEELYTDYLYYLMSAAEQYLNSISTGAIQTYLSREDFEGLKIPVPTVTEQKKISMYLDLRTTQIDNLISKKKKCIELLNEEKTAIINEAVTKGLNPDVKLKDSGMSWLGEIPEHWDIKAISRITNKITNGYVGPTREILRKDGVRYIQSLHIKGNGIKFDEPYFVDEEWSKNHSRSILKEDDVLIVQTGAVGEVGIVEKEYEDSNCHALIILTTNKKQISGKYLMNILTSNYGYHKLKSIRTGALHPHLNSTFVRDIQIPIPPIEEQKQILNLIDKEKLKITKAISLLNREILLLEEYRTALISETVTGKIDVRDFV